MWFSTFFIKKLLRPLPKPNNFDWRSNESWIFWIRGLKALPGSEKPYQTITQDQRNNDDDRKRPFAVLKWQVRQIHAIKWGYKCRNHENDGDKREPVDKYIHIVAHDGCISFHGTTEDVYRRALTQGWDLPISRIMCQYNTWRARWSLSLYE